MALEPFFSISALSPQSYTYDPATPDAAYARGSLYTFGGFTAAISPFRVADQHSNDEIVAGFDPVNLANQTIGSLVNGVYGRSAIFIVFTGFNVSRENQYLLLFLLRGILGGPSARFFVGNDLVRTEALLGDEQVAILLDTPGDAILTYIYVRLASPNPFAALGFKGMDCYLL